MAEFRARAEGLEAPSQGLRLDHILVGVDDLGRGIERLARETGVRPTFGGSHPELGTHNALLGLGPALYLELIAIRPEVDDSGALESLRECSELTAVGWAVSTNDRARTAERLREAGFSPGPFLPGGRVRAYGDRLSWHLFTLGGSLLGTTPFFIEWGDGTIHPAEDSPGGCRLRQFSICDPEAEELKRLMSALGLEVSVEQSAERKLLLALDTPNGRLALGGQL